MNCSKCGAPLESDAKFCAVCGSPVEAAPAPAPAPAPVVPEMYSAPQSAPAGGQGYVPGAQGGYTPGAPAGAQGGYTPGAPAGGQGGYVPGAGAQGGYTPGAPAGTQGGYTPGAPAGGQGGYTPGGGMQEGAQNLKNAFGGFASKIQSSIPSGGGRGSSGDTKTSMNKAVRRYFLGGAPKWVTIMIIIGIPLLFVGVGIFLIILGLILKLIFRFIPNFKGEAAADQAWAEQKAKLQQRGLDKLNVIAEQVSLIDPVYVVGYGDDPDVTFDLARNDTAGVNKAKGLFGNMFGFLKKQTGTEEDPVEAYKFGSDDIIRSMLMQLTIFMFTDTQLLMYSADVDISTGMVYHECTNECFYSDVEAMNFTQSVYKVFNVKKKKYVNRNRESMVLYMSGSSFRSSINMDMNSSTLDNQFMAMRNLIRDKKNV